MLPGPLSLITIIRYATWCIYTFAYMHHIPQLCDRLSGRFLWFSMSGLLFILFGSFIIWSIFHIQLLCMQAFSYTSIFDDRLLSGIVIQIIKQIIQLTGWCEPSCWVQSCQFYSSRSLSPAMSHSVYMLTCIHHMPPLCNRLSRRFRWFSLNGLLFILFGFFINLSYINWCEPSWWVSFRQIVLSDHCPPPHHRVHIYVAYMHPMLRLFDRLSERFQWFGMMAFFLYSLVLASVEYNKFQYKFHKLQFSGICYRPLCLLHRILL